MNKPDSERMLQLDDLIDEHAYDEYVILRSPVCSFSLISL